jgi:hypothetical protein
VSKQYTDLANFVENLVDISKSDFQMELLEEGQSFSVSSFIYLLILILEYLEK